MNDAITLWTGHDRLQLTLGDPSLAAGVAVHGLRIDLRHQALWLDPNNPTATATVLLEAYAWLDQGHRPVGPFTAGTVGTRGYPVNDSLVLHLTDEQLIALDIVRGPGDLALRIDVTATVLTGAGGQTAPATGQVGYRIPTPLWHRLLDAAGAETGVTVRVPSPLTGATIPEGAPEAEAGASTARLAKRFREARGHLREGRYEDCVAACRKILEALITADESVVDRPRDRDQAQRWAHVRNAASALASAAHHDDDVTNSMAWTRLDAEPLLAITAALLTQARR